MAVFEIRDRGFFYDGKPIQILSGAIHYFRTVPEYWEDRLMKLKACGFNTLETYIPWNLHEPREGKYDFQGIKDVVAFVRLAEKLGLMVILRPAPYICAEWECGGLPSWLANYPSMRYRCCDPLFMEKIDAYFDVLFPMLKPLLCTNGGPVIAMQIENEYGSYGNDKAYLEHMRQSYMKHGIDVELFTSDGPDDLRLSGGTLDHVYKTANFGSRTEEAFAVLGRYETRGPLMCMEYWDGWFDHWGDIHHTTNPEDVLSYFEDMIRLDGHVNFYMFHGGTNFGFMSGANHKNGKIEPTVTSYDYDALLTEAGDLTDKYRLIQASIKKHFGIDETIEVSNTKKKAYGKVTLSQQGNLFKQLEKLANPIESVYTKTMEEVGQDYGFILYRHTMGVPVGEVKLRVLDYHDRAMVYLNGEYQGVLDRTEGEDGHLMLDVNQEGMVLDLLVENLGRINYGEHLGDHKGITKGVTLNNQFLFNWTIYPLTLEDVQDVVYEEPHKVSDPAFYRGYIEIDEVADTFIATKGLHKGVMYVNGFNLGRYWEDKGPQHTMYVPGPILRQGKNEIVIFELHGLDSYEIQWVDEPVFDV